VTVWISIEVVYAIHDLLIKEHGGSAGIRDKAVVESAIARPRNIASYLPQSAVDIAMLAAAYAYGIVQNHPFADGNKRTGFVLLELSLRLNGWQLVAMDEDCVTKIQALAAGTCSETELAAWVRAYMKPLN